MAPAITTRGQTHWFRAGSRLLFWLAFLCLFTLFSLRETSAETIVPVAEDVMASAFFQDDDRIRGYANETPVREVNRVSSNAAFDIGPELVFMTFDYDFPQIFAAPIRKATLTVTTDFGGLGADATTENPFQMAVSGLTADPLASITDDTNPGGTIGWRDFFDSNVLEPDTSAKTIVTGVGQYEFDATSIVNSWIDGSNDIFALALNGKFDSTSDGNVSHGIANNSFSPEKLSHFLTIVVPEPNACHTAAILVFGLSAIRARRRAGLRKN